MVDLNLISGGASLIASLAALAFFGNKYQTKKCTWEYIFYMGFYAVEAICTIIWGGDHTSWMYQDFTGIKINVLRQAFFLFVTPVQMKILYNVLRLGNPQEIYSSYLMGLILTNQFMLANGLICFWFPPLCWQWSIFFLLAWCHCVAYCAIAFEAGMKVKPILQTYEEKALLEVILYLFYGINIAIGFWYMTATEAFNLFSIDVTNAVHEVSYLIAKPAHAFLCWKFINEVYKGPKPEPHHEHEVAGTPTHGNTHGAAAVAPTGFALAKLPLPPKPRFILVEVNQDIYATIKMCADQLNGTVEVADSSDRVFALLANGAERSIVLLSYNLLQANTQTMIQSVNFITKKFQ